MRRVFVIHIMKTGGTSLRHMLLDAIDRSDLYPNDNDLAKREPRWYLGTRELLEHDREGKSRGARVLIGHLPFVAAEELSPRPLIVTVLREPISRTISMLEHRRQKSPSFAHLSYAELLNQEKFVEQQIRNYQTKVFAFDSIAECPRSVNMSLDIDDGRFDRALTRLQAVDVLGLTEDFPAFAQRMSRVTGINLSHVRRDNPGSYSQHTLSPHVLERVNELISLDHVLYDRARRLLGQPDLSRGK